MPACRYLHVLGTVLLTFLLVGFLPSVAFASTKVNSPTPPAITTQPANQTVTAGQTASFTAAATGSPTPTVQWLVSTNSGATFSNISGATSTTLSFTTALSQSGNQYRAVFTNRAGTATTTAATLTVNAPPPPPPASGIITLQNTNSNLCIDTGGSTSFTTLIQSPCSTSNTQKFNLTAAPVSGWYYLVSAASNLCWDVVGGSSSAGALIQQYTCVAVWPEYFQLKAVPGGYEILSGNMTNGCLGVVGASTASGANIAQNTCTGSKNQIFVLPSNNTPPTITTQPASQTVTASQTASFTAAASGSPTPTVQWQVSTNSGATFSDVSGATSTTLSFTTALSQSGNQYHAVFTNSAGTAATTAATLTVVNSPTPPSITTQPANQTVTAGQTASFTAAASGSPTPTVQWQVSTNSGATFSNISGATSTTLSFTTALSQSGNQYHAVFTNSAGTAATTAATLTVNAVNQPPTVNAGAAQTITLPSSATLNGTVADDGLPAGSTLTTTWSKVSGAGTVTFGNANALSTTASFSAAGIYSLRLTASDTAVSSTSDVTITVNPAPAVVVFGYAVQGAAIGATMSNTVSATRYQMAGQNGTVTSMSAFIASPVSAPPNNQFQVAIYADNNGVPGALVASSGSQAIVADAWNTVPISAPVAANAYYWLSYNTNGLAANSNNLRYDAGGGPSTWISPEPFGTWPANYGPIGGAGNDNASMYATVVSSGPPVSNGHLINVTTLGAKGNGTNDDTAAIKSAIATLTSGDTLLFPCGTYLTTSQLFINVSNVTVDGSSCATIRNTSSGTVMVIGGSGNGNPNYSPPVALSTTANELGTSFTTVSSLGAGPGNYVYLQQGGKDSSTGSGDTGCDPSGCRGEVLKVASVSGNTITVTTALHDTYNPSVNAATARKISGPLTGITIRNIIFDGSGSNVYGLAMAGVAESTVSGVTSRNVQGAALLNRGDFNVAWSNISVTGAGSAQCGDAVWFEDQGNLSVNGMSISNENRGTGSGCLANGAFGFGMIAAANSTIINLTVDAAGAFGRPFKTTAARWNTFNSLTVKNGVQAYNGISLEYYSSHNTFNSCVVTNNGAGTGTGTGNAGINTFGNFNQYNTFNNCTVTGNGNVQLLINNFDALRLGQDIGNEIIGGTYTGTNSVQAVIEINGSNASVASSTISGPGAQGLHLGSTNACVNNNIFGGGTGLGAGIWSTSGTNIGSSNTMNGYSSNLTAGTCNAP